MTLQLPRSSQQLGNDYSLTQVAGESKERDEKSGKERRMKNQGRFLVNANPSFKAQIKCLCLKRGLWISSPGWFGVPVHLLVPLK